MPAKMSDTAKVVKYAVPVRLNDEDFILMNQLLQGKERHRSTLLRQAFRFYANHLLEKTAA
jgi:hypothetical protein